MHHADLFYVLSSEIALLTSFYVLKIHCIGCSRDCLVLLISYAPVSVMPHPSPSGIEGI